MSLDLNQRYEDRFNDGAIDAGRPIDSDHHNGFNALKENQRITILTNKQMTVHDQLVFEECAQLIFEPFGQLIML